MRRRLGIAAVAAGLPAVLLVGALAAVPPIRNVAVAWWHDPASLPALPADPRVHYESGAEAEARAVAAALPAAMAMIERAQGRPFAGRFTVGVYATEAAFALASGAGASDAAGTSLKARLQLAPRIWRERDITPAKILAHELSHVHLRLAMGELAYLRLPNWFVEGLAVMASDGGGAEQVSPEAARTAIAAGRSIVVSDRVGLFGSPPQPRDRFAPGDRDGYRMIYRQAGLFVADLKARDPAAFSALLDRLVDGRGFAEAFAASFGLDAAGAWRRFAADQGPPRPVLP